MPDVTIIYYTDNSLPIRFATAVRTWLQAAADAAGRIPIVSVSHEPILFGQNLCVGQIGRSYRSILFQILLGASATRTRYVALCEHDVLYPPEHFALRPANAPVVFDQNRHRALIEFNCYSKDVGGRSMQLVIADREVLIGDITAKLRLGVADKVFFKSFEPSKGHQRYRSVPEIAYEMTPSPGVGILDICNHGGNYGVKKRRSGQIVDRLEPWGTIDDLCEQYHIPRKAVT